MANYVTSPDNITVPGPGTLVEPIGMFKALADSVQAGLASVRALVTGLGAWQSYDVVWRQSDGTALAIGNGSLVGRYAMVGKTVVGTVILTRGTTTNVGTSAYQWNLPITQRSYAEVAGSGVVMPSSGTPITANVIGIGAGAIGLLAGSNGARIGNASRSWAAGDTIRCHFMYEAA